MDFNKTLREKGRKEVHKDAACCSEQTPETAPHKTPAVQPLISDFMTEAARTKL